jgi:hypothetical protein
MQTFVCYHSHVKTMADLDNARLGKQRLETLQILRALRGETDAYANHPAVRMWEGYEPALVLYGLFVCHEWRIVRGHKDALWGDLAKLAKEYGMLDIEPELSKTGRAVGVLPGQEVEPPPWLGDKWVLRSHRSNLLRKAPHIYRAKYDGTPENMPYLWPELNHKGPGGYWLHISKPDLARLETGERVLPQGLEIGTAGYVGLTPEEN